ncbi:MAG: methyltransferase [Mollicutes bacterium]|nr:methyltransferase [Mollicutes bacterium]
MKVKVNNQGYRFFTNYGVFSKKGLDFGTKLLLESLPYEKLKGNILDFGCGYGPIGIIISKRTKIKVDMIDINKRSLKLAEKNALLNKVDVNIFESNIYDNINKKI